MTSPNKRLFVGSLPYRYSESDIIKIFVQFGKVVDIKIVRDKFGKNRGWAYVEFESLDSAITAQQQLHGTPVGDRTIIVDFAKPDPFLTPEGQARHEEAVQRRGQLPRDIEPAFDKKAKKTHRDQDNFAKAPSSRGYKPGKKIRQSVFDSRAHGSKVGQKFARRNKNKNK
jgi:RNA recognition motif-containing protein